MMHTEMGDRDEAEDAEDAEDAKVDVDEEITEETVVLTETGVTDNVGDVSVEINVEELVAEIEASQGDDAQSLREHCQVHANFEHPRGQRCANSRVTEHRFTGRCQFADAGSG